MELEPRHRYQSAQEFSEDLSRFVAGEPVRARQVSSLERLWLWSRKNVGLAVSLAMVLLLLLAGTVGSTLAAFVFESQKVAQETLANANLSLAVQREAETTEAIAQRDVAHQNAYFADIRQAQQDWENGQTLRMLQTLRSYVPTLPGKDIRGWEWYHLLSRANQNKVTMLDHDGYVTQVEWSADGERLFSLGTDGTLRIWNRDGQPIRKITIPGVLQFAFSPDKSRFATASGDPVLRIWETDSGKLLATHKTDFTALKLIDWNAASDQIARWTASTR